MNIERLDSNPLPLTYRQTEVDMLGRCLRAGDSCSVVGVSGMAKSNLFRYLLEPGARQHYLGDNWGNYLFLAIDSHGLAELSERATYDLLHQCLISEARQQNLAEDAINKIEQAYQQVLNSTDDMALQRAFVRAVQTLMADVSRRLVLLFDQFDETYKTLESHFFANLRSIRDQYKYRVSYVVFTREELPRICDTPECEEFYELFSANVLVLGPYNYADALLLLKRINSRYDQSLPLELNNKIIEITGAHPGLLKAACMALIHDQTILSEDKGKAIETLLMIRDVHTECTKLWVSFDDEERDALRALVGGRLDLSRNADVVSRLKFKRLITSPENDPKPFSPLFAKYISQQKASRPPESKIKAGPLRIDTAGEVWVEGRQVVPAFSRKELLLLEYLCLEPGRLRTKDEIIAVVYPDEYRSGGTVSDDALNALVKRVRDRIELFSNRRHYIVNVRGKGYRLDITTAT